MARIGWHEKLRKWEIKRMKNRLTKWVTKIRRKVWTQKMLSSSQRKAFNLNRY